MFLYLTIIYIDIMKWFFLSKELSLLIGEDPTVKFDIQLKGAFSVQQFLSVFYFSLRLFDSSSQLQHFSIFPDSYCQFLSISGNSFAIRDSVSFTSFVLSSLTPNQDSHYSTEITSSKFEGITRTSDGYSLLSTGYLNAKIDSHFTSLHQISI